MANRNLLHKKRLPEFKTWLDEKSNCVIEPTKGGYECLRFRINDTLHIIFENHRKAHLSMQPKTIYLVRQFLDDMKKEKSGICPHCGQAINKDRDETHQAGGAEL